MLNCLDIFDVAVMFKQYTQVIKSKVWSEDPARKPPCGTSRKSTALRRDHRLDVHGFRHKHDPDAPLIFRVIMVPRRDVRRYASNSAVREVIGRRPPPRGSSCLITRRSS